MKSMMRCATSTLSPSMLMTTVRPLSNVSVISISSSIELLVLLRKLSMSDDTCFDDLILV